MSNEKNKGFVLINGRRVFYPFPEWAANQPGFLGQISCGYLGYNGFVTFTHKEGYVFVGEVCGRFERGDMRYHNKGYIFVDEAYQDKDLTVIKSLMEVGPAEIPALADNMPIRAAYMGGRMVFFQTRGATESNLCCFVLCGDRCAVRRAAPTEIEEYKDVIIIPEP